MPRNNESFRDRASQVTLFHWGVMCIFGSIAAGIALRFLPAKDQAEQLGRSIGVSLGWIAGIVLFIIHFIRRDRRKTTDQPRARKATGKTKRKHN